LILGKTAPFPGEQCANVSLTIEEAAALKASANSAKAALGCPWEGRVGDACVRLISAGA